MTNKFTEEQYQNIIKATKDIVNSGDIRLMGTNASISVYSKLYATDKVNQLPFRELENEIMAIVNPLTREWAHDKFVEKEKEFYWTGKKANFNGHVARLYKDGNGMVSSYPFNKVKHNINSDEQLTESEIKAWGYDPEMFYREEV